jgi:hypothetical protein
MLKKKGMGTDCNLMLNPKVIPTIARFGARHPQLSEHRY